MVPTNRGQRYPDTQSRSRLLAQSGGSHATRQPQWCRKADSRNCRHQDVAGIAPMGCQRNQSHCKHADSDEVARAFREDVARRSDMMPPAASRIALTGAMAATCFAAIFLPAGINTVRWKARGSSSRMPRSKATLCRMISARLCVHAIPLFPRCINSKNVPFRD